MGNSQEAKLHSRFAISEALNIDEYDEEHKVDYYFDHSLTLKLVELFLLAKKFLLSAEVKTAALDKLGFIQLQLGF